MKSLRISLLLALITMLVCTLPLFAFEVEVTVENVSPDGGTLITPVWVGFHAANFDSYDGGVSLDGFPGMEEIVEDGNIGPLSASFANIAPMGIDGAIPGPNGPLFPGESNSMRFDIVPTYHRYFSYVSMVIPSNDAFVANGNPSAHRLFDTDGNFTPFEFYILGNEVNDGGTEVNDEIPANTAALAQAAPQTGVDENGVVTDHPGFIPGGNILDARPNGQFIAPGYRIAKITVRAVPTTSIRVFADGGQEVPPVTTDATAACYASLNDAQNALTVSCEHDVVEVAAAHVHEAAAGSNGPVVFPFDDPTSPFSQTFEVNAAQVASLLAGNYYINIHSAANPGGEVRAQIDGCFAGPESLCLQDGRFKVEVDFNDGSGVQTARGIQQGNDSGFFYFFGKDNVELLLKVINACAEDNPRYWVFASGLTNLGVDVTVTDTQEGQTFAISSDNGQTFAPVLNTNAFNTCP